MESDRVSFPSHWQGQNSVFGNCSLARPNGGIEQLVDVRIPKPHLGMFFAKSLGGSDATNERTANLLNRLGVQLELTFGVPTQGFLSRPSLVLNHRNSLKVLAEVPYSSGFFVGFNQGFQKRLSDISQANGLRSLWNFIFLILMFHTPLFYKISSFPS